MFIYLLFSFIFCILIHFININYVLKIINLIFYNSHNNLLYIGVFLGILIKILLNTKITKDIYKYIPLILLDILKIHLIKYNYILVIFSLLISIIYVFLLRKRINNKLIKILVIISYFISPISLIILIRILDNKISNYSVFLAPYLLIFIINNINILFSFNLLNLLYFIIVLLFSFNMFNININIKQKRNITTIFLLLSYLFYYYFLC